MHQIITVAMQLQEHQCDDRETIEDGEVVIVIQEHEDEDEEQEEFDNVHKLRLAEEMDEPE